MGRFIRFIVILVFLMRGFSVQAQTEKGWHDSIKTMPDFQDVGLQLQVLVNIYGFAEENRFCIVGWKSEDQALVYWINEDKLILWELQDNNYALLASRGSFDLRTDVVPDSPDYTGQYLTRSEIRGIIKDCFQYGDIFYVSKTIDGWVSISQYDEFSNVRDQLQDVVDEQGHKKENHICVIGQKSKYYVGAYVYWPEEDRLIYWLPDPYDFQYPRALTNQFGDINLKIGVGNNEDEDKYMHEMQAKYVNNILHICKKTASILIS